METDVQFWDGIAERYSRKPIENVPAYERKLKITRTYLEPGHIIADIGCGTGSLALELAPSVGHVHAVDLSSEMLDIARRKAAKGATGNLTFHQSVLPQLPELEPGSLDGVCAYNILHLVEGRRDLLARVFQLLKPGGFLVSSTVCLGESRMPYGLLLAVMRWLRKAPSVQILTKQAVVDELCQAGFGNAKAFDVGAKATTLFLVATKPQA